MPADEVSISSLRERFGKRRPKLSTTILPCLYVVSIRNQATATNAPQKHYCDYCDVFLTHDSTSVRKAHNNGRNHLSNVRDYYACQFLRVISLYFTHNLLALGHDKAQNIIDQITSAYETSGGPPPGGFGFGPQHLGGPAGPPMGFGGPPPGFGGPPPGYGGREFLALSV